MSLATSKAWWRRQGRHLAALRFEGPSPENNPDPRGVGDVLHQVSPPQQQLEREGAPQSSAQVPSVGYAVVRVVQPWPILVAHWCKKARAHHTLMVKARVNEARAAAGGQGVPFLCWTRC